MGEYESLLSKYRTELMGMAAIDVILCHAVSNGVLMPSRLGDLLTYCNVGVDVFLLVSGFGMYFSLCNVNTAENLIDWYKSRIRRIFMPYVLIMLPYWMGYCLYKGIGIGRFFYYFSTLSFWCEHIGTWYVAALIPIYFFLPFAFFLWKRSPVCLTLVFIAGTMLASTISYEGQSFLTNSIIYNLQYVLIRMPSLWVGLYWAYYSSAFKDKIRGGGGGQRRLMQPYQ